MYHVQDADESGCSLWIRDEDKARGGLTSIGSFRTMSTANNLWQSMSRLHMKEYLYGKHSIRKVVKLDGYNERDML